MTVPYGMESLLNIFPFTWSIVNFTSDKPAIESFDNENDDICALLRFQSSTTNSLLPRQEIIKKATPAISNPQNLNFPIYSFHFSRGQK
jgi:hypothetical protein